MKKWISVILSVMLSLGVLFSFSGCTDYGYWFHYRVEGGNGGIEVETNRQIRRCNEDKCGLDCPINSHFIALIGGKRGSHTLTFIATPNEGYQVKEWIFNGKTVEGNKSNTYTASVSNKDNYNGVIIVVFEPV